MVTAREPGPALVVVDGAWSDHPTMVPIDTDKRARVP